MKSDSTQNQALEPDSFTAMETCHKLQSEHEITFKKMNTSDSTQVLEGQFDLWNQALRDK